MIKRILEKIFRLEPEVCTNCETFRSMLESEKRTNNDLIQTIIDFNKPKVEFIQSGKEDLKPITGPVPWRVRRQMLEQEDRERAKIMKRSNEELEAAIGIKDVTGPKEKSNESIAGTN